MSGRPHDERAGRDYFSVAIGCVIAVLMQLLVDQERIERRRHPHGACDASDLQRLHD